MLRIIRIMFAIFFFMMISLLFLDFTGVLSAWFGWMAKIQFIPAILALNIGVLSILIGLTFLFGRVYCSVICPLGILQDIVNFFAEKYKKNHFNYMPEYCWIRYGILIIFIGMIVGGLTSLVAFISPYSIFGRIVSNLLGPIYCWGNNGLAFLAEHWNSYTFYTVDIWLKSMGVLIVAVISFILLCIFSWFKGRLYCNTICPVGTFLGLISRFSIFKMRINQEKCINCGVCAKKCKSSCIDSKEHRIDYSRCVVCMDCLKDCHSQAISFTWRKEKIGDGHIEEDEKNIDKNEKNVKKDQIKSPEAIPRRKFFSLVGLFTFTTVLQAQEKKVDGGLAVIENKKVPKRLTSIKPAGAKGLLNFSSHCTACQLCVSVCPNQVLRPSSHLENFMQPEVSYERGYCRPECTRCSEVCPTSAITKITPEQKSSIQVGHAVWVKENCVVLRDNVDCVVCSSHCLVGAIQMIQLDPKNKNSRKIPIVDTERCIGCGACENLCPARPFSAIYIEGHEVHREI